MITLKELKSKCQKFWDTQRIQKSVLDQDILFPLKLAKIRFTARELADDFGGIRKELQYLHEQSKAKRGYGYTLLYQTVQHRQLGRQDVPEAIVFETKEDFLKFSGLGDLYRIFCDVSKVILTAEPLLSGWLKERTVKVIEYKDVWPRLLSVAAFLRAHPNPNCYLRELPIPGVDTKFIEQYKAILRELLDVLLEPKDINAESERFQHHGFERRYGFKYPEPLIRFRILDPELFKYPISDLSLTVGEFQALTCPCNYIIITENKVNGLSIPLIESAIVIFGLGYGIQSLANIPWFQGKEIYYWGDIDTHGFAMLSQLRSYYPQVKNLLMDQATVERFKVMAVEEPTDKRCIANLIHLTDKEQALYQALCQNTVGKNLRIEQERLDFNYVQQRLRQLFILSS